jgi:hypothetical protein
MKGLFILAGAIAGALIVRYFVLDFFEITGWKMFWKALSSNHFKFSYLQDYLSSSGFAKSLIGTALGAVFGYLAASKIKL